MVLHAELDRAPPGVRLGNLAALFADERQLLEVMLAENAQAVSDYYAGKETILKFLVGQLMRATRGKANPALANEVMLEKLRASKPS